MWYLSATGEGTFTDDNFTKHVHFHRCKIKKLNVKLPYSKINQNRSSLSLVFCLFAKVNKLIIGFTVICEKLLLHERCIDPVFYLLKREQINLFHKISNFASWKSASFDLNYYTNL